MAVDEPVLPEVFVWVFVKLDVAVAVPVLVRVPVEFDVPVVLVFVFVFVFDAVPVPVSVVPPESDELPQPVANPMQSPKKANLRIPKCCVRMQTSKLLA